jgi:MFS family permease
VPERLLAPGNRRVTAGLVGLITLAAFDAIAVATAMPVVARDLDATPLYAWSFTGFFAAYLFGTVVSGEACDTRGPRRPMQAGLLLFVSGLLLSGLAPTMLVLVLGRALQGLGAGLMLVAVYVVVARAFPDHMRPKVFSAMAAAWVVPAVVGPVVAGYFADHLSWRLVFLSLSVLVLPAAWAIAPVLRRVDGPPPEPVTRTGRKRLALGAAVGVAALQQAGISGGLLGGLLLVVAVALMAASVPRLLPPGTLVLRRGLPTVVAMRGLLAGPFAATEAFIPLMLVDERGLSTTMAGLSLMGSTLGWATGSWLQGRAGPGTSRTTLIRWGTVWTTAGTAVVTAAVVAPAPGWVVTVGWTAAGIGMGIALASVNVVALRLARVEDQGATSAAIQVSDGLATVVLTAVAGSVLAVLHTGAGEDASVFLTIFGLMTAVAAGAVLAARRTGADPAVGVLAGPSSSTAVPR